MKKLLIIASCLGLTSAAFAQGTLLFANLAGGVNFRVTNNATGAGVTSPLYLADLYFSTTTSSATDGLQAAGFNVPFSTTTAQGGGYFLGGVRSVTGVTGSIVGQVRVWNSQAGATFEAARAAGMDWGTSSTLVIALAIPPATPPTLAGLTSFGVGIIPEPSTFALAGLGAAALLIFRRRKQ